MFFDTILKSEFAFTENKSDFLAATSPKFAYTDEPIEGVLFFKSATLLFESEVRSFDPISVDWLHEKLHLKGFFPVNDSLFTFDVFASAFYLLSRYEEQLMHEKDLHGRFHAHNSIAYQQFFLQEPLVDYYAFAVAEILKSRYPELQLSYPRYSVMNTVDVDMAWKYRYKGFWRNLGGLIQDFFKGNIPLCIERIKVLTGKMEDPFQTFDFLRETADKAKIPLHFFWLLGKHGEFDKNTPTHNKHLRALINRFKANSGIHFSYGSHSSTNGFEKEQEIFASIISEQATSSRFHFLKYVMNSDFPRLIRLGIKEEYSMGYAMHEGFRASIARPFKWFDLKKNVGTDLTIVPFMFMDASFRYHEDLNDEEIRAKITHMLHRTKTVGGHCVALWHNDTFDEPRNNWRDIYSWFNTIAQ